KKLEEVGLRIASHAAKAGDRKKELFWLQRAADAGNEAARLSREETKQKTERPTELQVAILKNLARGRSFEAGLGALINDALPAMMQCVLAGWVDTGRITEEGRAVLAREMEFAVGFSPKPKPQVEHVEIRVIKEKPPIALPPVGGWRMLGMGEPE